VAEAVQQQWQQAFGIQINLSPADRNTHLKKIASGDFDVGDVNWYTFYHDPIYNLEFIKYVDAGFNGTKWQNVRYTELLDLSDVESNLAIRDEMLREAEEILINEMPCIPICYNTSKFAKNPEVYGESLSPIGMFELKKVDVDGGIILVNK
jgi:oligopeptide transport system substrate-binding protein